MEQHPSIEDQEAGIVVDSPSSAEVLEFLNKSGLDKLSCELCGAKAWILTSGGGDRVDTLALTVMGVDSLGFVAKAKKPFFFVFCADCGNTKQIYAELVQAKLRPDTSDGKEFLEIISKAKESIAKEESNG